MPEKEATARIKINKLLEAAGWRFFPEGSAPANIRLEPSVTIESNDLAALGDDCLTLREILEKVFGLIPRFKSRDELLEEEFAKFVADFKPEEAEAIPAIKTFFKAYVTSDQVRHIIESKDFTVLATHPMFSTRDFKAVPRKYRALVPEYIKDYVSLNQFAA